MQGNEELWKELCRQASVEQDAQKLVALIREINRLLAIKQDRLKGISPPDESPSSLWRTAYVSAIFETDPAKVTLKIADARAAITERLNSPIEIGRFEHEGIEAARQRLATLKAQRVEVVKLALSTGDTPT